MFTDRAALEAHIKDTPVTGSPAEMRRAFLRLAGPSQPFEMGDIAGVRCGIFGKGDPVVWLHGGGYVFGSSFSHANAARYMAKLSGRQIVVPDYRRAPEHPWPAQLHDVAKIMQEIGPRTPIIGDSAGGHLALNLALLPGINPAALALISPNTDRTGKSLTRSINSSTDLMNDDGDDAALAALAFGDLPAEHPHVSPVMVNLSALPATYLTASENEVLFGDAIMLHDRAAAAGVPITFDVKEDIFHMWHLWPLATTQAQDTLHRIAAILRDTRTETVEQKHPARR